uniref:Uncharacterized protein n=1 Tax=Anguilla anguilla TaxID=7936 RepID=A0A0E9V142_ANGAN
MASAYVPSTLNFYYWQEEDPASECLRQLYFIWSCLLTQTCDWNVLN